MIWCYQGCWWKKGNPSPFLNGVCPIHTVDLGLYAYTGVGWGGACLCQRSSKAIYFPQLHRLWLSPQSEVRCFRSRKEKGHSLRCVKSSMGASLWLPQKQLGCSVFVGGMVISYLFFIYWSAGLLTESLWGGEKAGAAGPELDHGYCCASMQRGKTRKISSFFVEHTVA